LQCRRAGCGVRIWWGRDIDELLAKNAATRLTLALMYATDFFDQVEHRILPALRSGTIVLADRFIFTLIARGVVRGINREYMSGLYAMALRPHLTFWLNVRPETAFGREFKKAQAISYWEAGRDMSLSHDLYWSFIRYQTMIKREFEVMAKKHNFLELDGEASVPAVNKQLRQRNRRAIRNSRDEVHSLRRACPSLAVDPGMSEPVHIAAIDAGSNAVRLSVARAYSALDIEPSTWNATRCVWERAFSCGTALAKRFSRKRRKPSGISAN